MLNTLPKPSARTGITADVVDYAQCKTSIHAVRQAVFVNEQQIPAVLESDELDPISHHVLAFWGDLPVGTGRLTPTGQIGRVAVSQTFRRIGVGRCIMETLLATAQQQRHEQVSLAAQHHAISFYERFGFYSEGRQFIKLGIQHVMMHKALF